MCGVLLSEGLKRGKAIYTRHLQSWICIDCLWQKPVTVEKGPGRLEMWMRDSFFPACTQLFPFEFCTIHIF